MAQGTLYRMGRHLGNGAMSVILRMAAVKLHDHPGLRIGLEGEHGHTTAVLVTDTDGRTYRVTVEEVAGE